MRLLLAEDEQALSRALVMILQKSGLLLCQDLVQVKMRVSSS